MKVKLIEAMAYGKAVVATSITLQGIQAPGAVVVADTADGFAQAVARLLSDRLERRRLGEIALETVAQHFSLQATTAQLVDAARILASQDLGDAKVADRSKPAGRR
jgi:succinoglycan biosynthesis protein ExoO